MVAQEVASRIVSKIHTAKYYSIIADCTPDISHTERIIRYVDLDNEEKVEVQESFLGFIPISDSTGKGLSSMILKELEEKNSDIDNCQGQGYDNRKGE